MKTSFKFCSAVGFFVVGWISMFAQVFTMTAVPIKVQVYVHDSTGTPIAGAVVHLALPHNQLGAKGIRVDTTTDAKGMAILSGTAQEDYSVSAEKVGYYPTQGPSRGINDDKSFRQFAVGTQKMDLELRQIRNPIGGISKSVEQLRIPESGKQVGFDLEVGDWVAPYGKGVNPDFVFRLDGTYESMSRYDQTLTLQFSHPNDGIIAVKFSPHEGPAFQFPYDAPTTGYELQRTWRSAVDGKQRIATFDLTGDTHYIVRVRTETDQTGKVVRALYGVIDGEIVFGGNRETGRNVNFIYRLNPDWTPNIEFDPALSAPAGTGKLVVQRVAN